MYNISVYQLFKINSDKHYVKPWNYLVRRVDKVLASLERIRARVQDEGAIAELDAKIAAMEELKAGAESSESDEDVKGVAKRIRNEWKETNRVMKNAVARVYGKKIGQEEGPGSYLPTGKTRPARQTLRTGAD